MKNIDKELMDWAIQSIEANYKEEIDLLIGQYGACKIPTDEQNIAFDFFVPSKEKGYQLAETFIIEELGYDLFPMSWERLEGIAKLNEKITFAFARGVVLYARNKEVENRFLKLQQSLQEKLADKEFCYVKALEKVETALQIYQTMCFEKSISHVRKAAGAIMNYLSMAIATFNSTYLHGNYGNNQFVYEVQRMEKIPKEFAEICFQVIQSNEIEEIKGRVHQLLEVTREFFLEAKEVHTEEKEYYYEDLANWYYEARYTFRRLEYYTSVGDAMSSFELGCYLQIEFDVIKDEFGLDTMNLMGYYDVMELERFAQKSKDIEMYIVETLKSKQVKLKIYEDFEAFLQDGHAIES